MATKVLSGVWRPGDGAEFWFTGLSVPDFQTKDRDMFAGGMRLVTLDTNGGISPVWGPGSDSQFFRTGMTQQQFVDENSTQLGRELRLISLRVDNGVHDAVWRSGTGSQLLLITRSLDELHAADNQHVADGLRIADVAQDFEKKLFYGVWRSDLGSGAQAFTTGMTEAQFKDEDARQVAAGLHLIRITSMKGVAGVWRSGTGGSAWALEQTVSAFQGLDQQHLAQGLRLINLEVGFV
jgi:hypothetical protein